MNERKQNRLPFYDYSQNGAYFITICTRNKQKILSSIRRDNPCGCPQVILSPLGEIAENAIKIIEQKYNIKIDKYVIMPNHIHMILTIDNSIGTAARAVRTISQIIGGYKSIVANNCLKICKQNNIYMGAIWQRSFHDHIIRNQTDYDRIWQYIDTNPVKWEYDCYYSL